jgi:DNA polymerase-3 subunit gamma/tau
MKQVELYKKHRPKRLSRIVGNEATVSELESFMEKDALPHTILFHGPSGCGKTTFGRIVRNHLDCSEIDFHEVNCSSNNGVDDIRAIERAMSRAATGGKFRVWLMDECHRLTGPAQDAALKMLEDTPSHVYFILCTTEPRKLKDTVRNRCTQLPVELVSNTQMKVLIDHVVKKEKAQLSDDLTEELIDAAAGSCRRALVILGSVLNLEEDGDRARVIKEEPGEKEVIDLCRALMKSETWKKVAKLLKEIKTDPEGVRYAVLGYARSCLLSGYNASQAADIIDAFADNFYDSKNAGLALACYEVIMPSK